MQNSFSILFYPKRNDIDKEGKVPVYMRITYGGKRSELSIKQKIKLGLWNVGAGKAKGFSLESKQLNRLLDAIRGKMYEHYRNMIEQRKEITAVSLKNAYLGIAEKNIMLVEVFANHNDQVKQLIGREFALNTYKRYETALKHIKEFLKHQYRVEDYPLKKINHEFITGFEFYLKSKKSCNHNSAIKYIKNFKKIIRIALANNWIIQDPFANYKVRLKEVNRDFLTQEEVEKMMNKRIPVKRIDQVRDIFVFCCYTGLSYADVRKLTKDNLVKGIDGGMWIKTDRTKTNTRSSIPLLPLALTILDKYKGNGDISSSEFLLPVSSNQKMNAYLKEIADLCGIEKNLTFHLARHTFATTITLTNGVSIESVSKMLGHRSLKTTQHYAKILDKRVSNDMTLLKSKLLASQK
ncbi:MAG: site-specific integrase [Ignavibacteriae bacterium]|nr:site-specific integrase [Ignavibacteriota bacterium]